MDYNDEMNKSMVIICNEFTKISKHRHVCTAITLFYLQQMNKIGAAKTKNVMLLKNKRVTKGQKIKKIIFKEIDGQKLQKKQKQNYYKNFFFINFLIDLSKF